MVQGLGILPTDFEMKYIHGQLNDMISDHILFKNPFKETITIQLMMESDGVENGEIFQLLMKKKSVVLQGQQSITIPFSFLAKQIASY